MPKLNYKVELTEDEMKLLKSITHKDAKASAKTILHANILLKTCDNYPEKKEASERKLRSLKFPLQQRIKCVKHLQH